MAQSVSAVRSVNLWSVTCYTDQNLKSKIMLIHFTALNLFISKKRFKKSYTTSFNLEDLDADFVLQHFDLCLHVNKGDEETES